MVTELSRKSVGPILQGPTAWLLKMGPIGWPDVSVSANGHAAQRPRMTKALARRRRKPENSPPSTGCLRKWGSSSEDDKIVCKASRYTILRALGTFPQSVFFLLLSSYMFRHSRHLQGPYTKIELKHATINSLQTNIHCCDVNTAGFG